MANLYTLLKASEKQARKLITKELKDNGYNPIVTDNFIYAEGSIPVLLVAHYDTVPNPPKYISNTEGILHAKKGLGADDRAGVYGLLEIARKHHCFMLFTGGEETGCIGAKAFTKSGLKPDVNYVIELDRRGTNDSVYYDGESEEFEKFVDSFGWQTAQGSCTDICKICPYLGVMGVNLSIGYQHEHTPAEILDTTIMNTNIERVQKMFDGPKFEWHERSYSYDDWGYYGKGYGSYGGYGYVDDYAIVYMDESGKENYDIVGGETDFEAIGCFMVDHPTLCYNDVLGVMLADEMDELYFNNKGEEENEQDTHQLHNQQVSTNPLDFTEWLDQGNKLSLLEW